MSMVTAVVHISRAVDDVYSYVADLTNRRRLLPDNFVNVRVLTEHTSGPGARFSFTIESGEESYESVTETVSVTPPSSLTDRTTGGDLTYETRWRFVESNGGATVSLETTYPPPPGWFARLLDRIVGRRALEQSLLVELLRLKQLLEQPSLNEPAPLADTPIPPVTYDP